MKCISFVCAILIVPVAFAEKPAAKVLKVAPAIERMKADLKFLSSDELEGRGVETEGIDKAAEFIRKEFKKAGLNVTAVNGGAFQPFPFNTGKKLGKNNALTFTFPNGKKVVGKYGKDFVSCRFGGAGKINLPVVFVGYGITDAVKRYDDYAGLDVKGKAVIILRRVPRQGVKGSPFVDRRGLPGPHAGLAVKFLNAKKHGAAAVFFVNDPTSVKNSHAATLRNLQSQVSQFKKQLASSDDELKAQRDAGLKKSIATAEKRIADLQKRLDSGNVPARRVAGFNIQIDGQKRAIGRYKEELKKPYKLNRNSVKKLLAAVEERLATKKTNGPVDELMPFTYGGNGRKGEKTPAGQITMKLADKILAHGKAVGPDGKVPTLAQIEKIIDKNLKPHSTETGIQAGGEVDVIASSRNVKNVIGVIEGRTDETIVIGAHYDHVGYGRSGGLSAQARGKEIHNGADDNGSGTVALIELARRYGARFKNEKPLRRIVFMAFTAEERGLVGSAYYCKNPIFPLKDTVAMFNMDMVGRMKDKKLIVYGTGTAKRWDKLLNDLNKPHSFKLSFKPEGFGPSDHSSFYAKKIPVLHYFTGTHGDYHRPGDDWNKINYADMARVVDYVQGAVDDTLERKDRPGYVEVKQKPKARGNFPRFGSIPDYADEGEGLRLNGVQPGGPAAQAGIKGGDRILSLGKDKVGDIQDFMRALMKHKAGDTVDVTVKRGKAELKVKVKLGKSTGR